MRLRDNDSAFLAHVDRWWAVLFGRLRRHLYQNGGPIVMVQVRTALARKVRRQEGGSSASQPISCSSGGAIPVAATTPPFLDRWKTSTASAAKTRHTCATSSA